MIKSPNKAFSLVEISVVILIIGILISGIATGLDLYYDTKINTARSLTKNSPVQRIDGLLTWIETTSPESFVTTPNNNDQIGFIKDLSFKFDKMNFIQTNSDNKPTYNQNGINNLPTLYFDGANDFMLSENSYTSSIFSNSQVTIFTVIKYLGANNITAVFLKHELAPYRTGLEINGGKIRFDFPKDSGNALIGINSIFNNNSIVTAIANKISQRIFINSALQASVANTNSINLSSSSLPIYLGRNHLNQFYTKFNFGELIIYDRALTDKELDSVTKYLSQKWAIKI